MYRTANGEEIFVIDGHTHFWDGSPANQKNIHGKQFIECFYAYHSNLSPPAEKWPLEKFKKYDAKTMYDDLFVNGYDDMAILQPTYLGDFYKNGFNTTERNSAMKKSHPERFILNGAFDPRDGAKGLEHLHELAEKYKIKGAKLYTAEWRGGGGASRRATSSPTRSPIDSWRPRKSSASRIFTSTRVRRSFRSTVTRSTSPISTMSRPRSRT